MMRLLFLSIAIAALSGAAGFWFCQQQGTTDTGSITVGRVENVGLDDMDMKLKARIDTGAGVSSMNAKIIKIIPPVLAGGKERVRFELTDHKGHASIIERNIVEWINIKNKGAAGGFTKRPVIVTDLCLGGKRVEARVNLADRADFIYPVLIGRNMLKTGDYIIDPRKKFMTKPRCK